MNLKNPPQKPRNNISYRRVGGGSCDDRGTIARRSGGGSRALARPVPFPLASPGLATSVFVTSVAARSDQARGKFTQPDRKKRA